VSTVIIICRKIKKPRPPKGPKTRRDNEEHPSLDYATGETEWINCGARHVCLSAPTSSRLDDCVPKILNYPITTQTGFQVDCPGRRVDSWTVKRLAVALWCLSQSPGYNLLLAGIAGTHVVRAWNSRSCDGNRVCIRGASEKCLLGNRGPFDCQVLVQPLQSLTLG
jgi:hypothetical protein